MSKLMDLVEQTAKERQEKRQQIQWVNEEEIVAFKKSNRVAIVVKRLVNQQGDVFFDIRNHLINADGADPTSKGILLKEENMKKVFLALEAYL
jgi:hypothetical protein